jgi:hypothetical protein
MNTEMPTLDELLAAVEAWRAKGKTLVYGSWGDGETCGCAVTALEAYRGLHHTALQRRVWAETFVAGFDERWIPVYAKGGPYELGRELRGLTDPDHADAEDPE